MEGNAKPLNRKIQDLRFKIQEKGQTLVELLLALGIFAFIMTAVFALVFGGLTTGLRTEEQDYATIYAQEGLDAARSIRDTNWDTFAQNGTHGVANAGAGWSWDSTYNETTYGARKFTREITVENVYRTASNDIFTGSDSANFDYANNTDYQCEGGACPSVNIDNVAGTAQLKKVMLGITPQELTADGNTKALYHLNETEIAGDGKIFYSISGDTTPKIRDYNGSGNTFASAASTVSGGTALQSVVKASPINKEMISGYVNSAGTLQVMCWNGTSWTNEWSVNVGGGGTTRRFDIAYETNSGDVIVAYSRNAAVTNAVDYRIKPGSTGCGTANWAGAASIPTTTALTTGAVHWVKMASDRRTAQNLISIIWADSNADLGASIWSGTVFGNLPTASLETALEIVATGQDVESFDVEYESLSGDVMIVRGSGGTDGANGGYYSVCTGGISSCTWGLRTAMPTILDDTTHIDISADPNSDSILFGAIGNAGSDLSRGVWNGGSWTNTANADTGAATPTAGTKFVATGWLISGANTRGVLVYYNSAATNIGWMTVFLGIIWTAQTDWAPTPVFGAQRNYDIKMNPINKDRLIFTVNDANSDIFAKRLILSGATFAWSDADGGAAIEANTGSATYKTFDFVYNNPRAADSSGNNNPGSLNYMVSPNGVVIGNTGLNQALSFDGVDDYVSVTDPGTSSLDLTNALTLEAWVNPDTSGTDRVIVGKENSYLMAVRSGTLQYAVQTAGTGAWVNTGLSVPTGSWSHAAITYNGTTKIVTGYVNGVPDPTPDTDTDGGSVTQNNNPLCIGSRGGSCTTASTYFDGSIDEVAIWDKVLTQADIWDHIGANLGYTANSYATVKYNPNPPGTPNKDTLYIDRFKEFVETATIPAGTSIDYQLSTDNCTTMKYWDGDSWEAGNVRNDIRTINRYFDQLTPSSSICLSARLNTTDANQTPVLDNVEIKYTTNRDVAAVLDTHTKRVASRVKWPSGFSFTDVELTEYLTDWNYNTWEQTTYNDFSVGSQEAPNKLVIKDSADPDNGALGKIEFPQVNPWFETSNADFIQGDPDAMVNGESVKLSPGFAPYSTSGAYTSAVYDAGQASDFTTASWTSTIPPEAGIWTQDTDADFNQGINTNTRVSGGSVALALSDSSFVVKTVYSVGNVGADSSLALGSDGFARISAASGNNLGFARCTDADCDNKVVTMVDSDGNVGRFSSLALGTDGFARISYNDYTNNRFKFVRCTDEDCVGKVINVIETAIGNDSSLALGSDGFARISYYDMSVGVKDLKFVRCTDADCAGKIITVVDPDSSDSLDSELSLVLGTDGFARISYTDYFNGLKFVRCTDEDCVGKVINIVTPTSYSESSLALGSDGFARISAASGNNLGFARCTDADCDNKVVRIIDSASSNEGMGPSLSLGSDGFARISYAANNADPDLKFARCTDTDCDNKVITIVDSAGDVGGASSLALGSDGFARISYYDATNDDLKFASPGYSSGAYTSAIKEVGTGAKFGTMTWAETLNGQTITMKVRSCNDDQCSGEAAFSTLSNIVNGQDYSASPPTGVNNGHGWVQYEATLSTTNTAVTPTLDSVTITTIPLVLEMRAGPNNTDCPGACTGWTAWSEIGSGATSSANLGATFDNNQYIQYQAKLSTANASYTPSLDDITINYFPLPLPYIFESQIHNAGGPVKFSSGNWSGSQPGSSALSLEARAGNLPDLSDATAWTSIGSGASGSFSNLSGLDNKQYFQYRVSFTPDESLNQGPTLDEAIFTYKVSY